MNIFKVGAAIAAPAWCVSCGRPVHRDDKHICPACISKIKYVDKACSVCSGELKEEGVCGICSDRSIYFDKNIAVAEYEGVMKAIIAGYKFGARKRMAGVLADVVFDKAAQLIEKADCVTAVPSAKAKVWKRGFNQAEEAAKIIAKRSGLPYISFLAEIPQAKKQKTLGFTDRFFNVLDRYRIRKKTNLQGRFVLLFDDVFTTGATINECSRVLKGAGAAGVFSLTAARVNMR